MNELVKSEMPFLQSDSDYQRYLEFKKYTDRLAKTLYQKNTDYGNAIAETGMIGCEVRLYDKLKRLRNIIENGGNAVDDEPLEDAFADEGGYSILWTMLKEKSPVFYNPDGTVITTRNGDAEKRKRWLEEHKKVIDRLILST